MKNLYNVLFDPRDVFISLSEMSWKPSIMPIILTAIVGLGSMFVLHDLLVEAQLEQTEKFITGNSKIPDDKKEEILYDSLEKIQHPSTSMKVIGYVSSTLATPFRIMWMSFIVIMIGNFFFGGKSSYEKIMVMTSYTYMIAILETFIKVPLMISQWRMNISMGLGLLNIGEPGDFIYNFLNGMDLFALWRIILLAIGMSVLYRRDVKPFFIALMIYWILQTTFFSFIGSIFT